MAGIRRVAYVVAGAVFCIQWEPGLFTHLLPVREECLPAPTQFLGFLPTALPYGWIHSAFWSFGVNLASGKSGKDGVAVGLEYSA